MSARSGSRKKPRTSLDRACSRRSPTVARQEEQPQLAVAVGSEVLDLLGPVDRMAIDEEEHWTVSISHELCAELDEPFSGHRAGEGRKPQQTFGGDCRDHVQTEPSPRSCDHRGGAFSAPGGAGMMV